MVLKNHVEVLKRLIMTCFTFTVCILYSYQLDIQLYPYDSWHYWILGDSFFGDVHFFDLYLFPETCRGYFFPLLIGLTKFLFGSSGWRIPSALFVSFLFGLILPQIFKSKASQERYLSDGNFGNKMLRKEIFECVRTVALVFFFLYVWGDFVQYPLSDIPAFFFMLCGVLLIRTILESRAIAPKGLLLAFLSGCFFYSTYNTRTVYLYAVLFLLIIVIVRLRKHLLKLLLTLFFIALGAILIAIPQCLINHKYVGTYSPKVYTEQISDYKSNLEDLQLLWGMKYSRYEGYVGDLDEYPSTSFIFEDKTGNEILIREGISQETFSFSKLLEIFLKYPIDMCGIYGRHLISAATPIFNEAYISNIRQNKTGVIIASIFIWILAGISLLKKHQIEIKSLLSSDIMLFGSAIIPSLMQVFGAVEARFFLPVYIYLYSYVFLCIDYKQLWFFIKKNLFCILVISLLVFLIWISLVGIIISQNENMVFLIDNIF